MSIDELSSIDVGTTYYAIQCPYSRVGEFEFLCHNQGNISTNKEKTLEDMKDYMKDNRYDEIDQTHYLVSFVVLTLTEIK